jgi:hypothetical protein
MTRFISYCFYHVLLTGFKSKFCNYLRVANSALSLLLFSLLVFREAATVRESGIPLINEFSLLNLY